MCGIWAFINLLKSKINESELYSDFMSIKSRGPDMSSFQIFKNIYIGFHRLAIMDLNYHANQPFILEDNDRTIIFICNGEIYNFKELIQNHKLEINNNSDCLTIPKLYLKYVKNNMNDITDFINLFKYDIKGEYAFILFEFDKLQNIKHIIVGRDHIGVRPLYYHPLINKQDNLIFSSEIKGLINFNDTITEFEPGTILKIDINDFGNIETYNIYDFKYIYNLTEIYDKTENYYLDKVRISVINSVKRRLMSERPIAFIIWWC